MTLAACKTLGAPSKQLLTLTPVWVNTTHISNSVSGLCLSSVVTALLSPLLAQHAAVQRVFQHCTQVPTATATAPMRYRAAVTLLAAAGAALAPSHQSRRRAVALRALTADALETKRLQCFSAFDESETRLAMRLIAAAESEEASLADSASEVFASSLARLRRLSLIHI